MVILLCAARRHRPVDVDASRWCGSTRRHSPARALVYAGLAERLRAAHLALPAGIGLRVAEGHRRPPTSTAIIAAYSAGLWLRDPGLRGRLGRLTSRFVRRSRWRRTWPGRRRPDLVDGAATCSTSARRSTRRPSRARPLLFAAAGIGADARAHRTCSPGCSASVGLSTTDQWWHWSYGDRYWALVTGARARLRPVVGAAAA